MTVTLLTVQTLTGSGTAITTLLPYPHPQSPKYLTGSAGITEVVWAVRGSSCSIFSILATPLGMSWHLTGLPRFALKLSLRVWAFGLQSNTWFLGPTRFHVPNGSSIGSASIAGLSRSCQTDKDRQTTPLRCRVTLLIESNALPISQAATTKQSPHWKLWGCEHPPAGAR